MSATQQQIPLADPAVLLKGLRDIHLPADPGWWPLAPAWWILIFVFLVVLVSIFAYLKKRSVLQKERAILEQYNHRLKAVLQQFEGHQNKQLLLQECSMLLRQLSIVQDESTANITGRQWIDHLDNLFDSNVFNNGIGQLFAEAHYRSDVDYDAGLLIVLMKDCLQQFLNQQLLNQRLPNQLVDQQPTEAQNA